MANRILLHKNKLDEFTQWCALNQVPTRPAKGHHQILQVCDQYFGWGVIYDRDNAKEHYTVDKAVERVVRKWIRAKKKIDKVEELLK